MRARAPAASLARPALSAAVGARGFPPRRSGRRTCSRSAGSGRAHVTVQHRRGQRRRRRHDIPGECADRCAAKPATATRAASIVTVVQPARTARTIIGGETTARRVLPSQGRHDGRRTPRADRRHDLAVGHAAASAARRRPSEARNERSEWRRQIAEEIGAKRRLERTARPRSGSPILFAGQVTSVPMVGSIGAIAECTAVAIVAGRADRMNDDAGTDGGKTDAAGTMLRG